jgi:hypothetical protein
MDMTILYKDKKVICDDEGITIKGYYQPVANDKKIFYGDIRSLESKKLSLLSGLSEIWNKVGSILQQRNSQQVYWAGFDAKRLFKGTAIIIDDGNLVKSIVTPENPDEVFRILREKALTSNLETEN